MSLAYHLLLPQIPGLRHVAKPLDRQQLADLRNRATVSIVAHAYENVPFYRTLFDQHGVTPRDIHGVDDLVKLPLTSRTALQAQPTEQVVAKGFVIAKLERRRTSGSTGAPLSIFRSRTEDLRLSLFRLRAMRHLEWKPWDRVGALTTTHTIIGGLPGAIHALGRRIGLARRTTIDALQPPPEIIAALRRLKPDIIIGYAGVLALTAELMTEEDREFIRPRFVLSGAEVLTPAMRDQVSRGFGVPVREYYGSHEFVTIGWECLQNGGFHLCDDNIVVEVLKDGRRVEPGEQGEIVITGLHNRAMPFIRYRQGDVVVRGVDPCGCGQPFSTIKWIEGRMLDWFILPDGRWLHPYNIVVAIRDIPWLRRFQLIQLRQDLIQVKVVPSGEVSDEELSRVRDLVAERVGSNVRIEITRVRDMSLEQTGKFRVAYSRLASRYGGSQ